MRATYYTISFATWSLINIWGMRIPSNSSATRNFAKPWKSCIKKWCCSSRSGPSSFLVIVSIRCIECVNVSLIFGRRPLPAFIGRLLGSLQCSAVVEVATTLPPRCARCCKRGKKRRSRCPPQLGSDGPSTARCFFDKMLPFYVLQQSTTYYNNPYRQEFRRIPQLVG